MIIHATDLQAQPDPLFLLQGGPGGSTIDTYAEILLTTLPLLHNRDIVLFDQRGTYYSEPSLVCSEFDQLLLDTIEKDLPDEEYNRLEAATYQACRDRLQKQGVELSAYNSLENSADIQAIRQALGYDQINLYGVSYGTLLALHTMRFYPENIRSVILDAVVLPQTNFILEVPQTAQRAFSQLFSTCAQDEDCSKTYPDLENRFYQVVEKLNQTPATVGLTDPDSGITYQALIDGDTFLDGIFQFLYLADLIPALPQTIVDAENGEFGFFARIFSILVFDRSYSYGMYFSVLCSEDADFTPDQVSLEGVHPQLAEAQAEGPEQFLNTCSLWQVETLDDNMDEPVESTLPVLVLSGSFDPITPPENGRIVAEKLPNSFVVEFPTGGHGAALSGDCQDGIIRAFLDQPDQPPDTGCIEPVESMEFFTPKSVINIPAVIQLLNIQNNREIEFLILLAANMMLFPMIFLVPSRWLWKNYRQASTQVTPANPLSNPTSWSSIDPQSALEPTGNPSDTRFSKIIRAIPSVPWLYWLFSMIAWLFLISFFLIIILMVVANDNRLWVGVPGQARFLFIMPLLMLLTTFFLVIAILKSWTAKHVKLLSKLGISFGLVFCFAILTILARWEILFALF